LAVFTGEESEMTDTENSRIKIDGEFPCGAFRISALSFIPCDHEDYMSADCFICFDTDESDQLILLGFSGYKGETEFEGMSKIGNVFWNDNFDLPPDALFFIANHHGEIKAAVENILKERDYLQASPKKN
jgi:hypothetical protein